MNQTLNFRPTVHCQWITRESSTERCLANANQISLQVPARSFAHSANRGICMSIYIKMLLYWLIDRQTDRQHWAAETVELNGKSALFCCCSSSSKFIHGHRRSTWNFEDLLEHVRRHLAGMIYSVYSEWITEREFLNMCHRWLHGASRWNGLWLANG